MDFLVQLLQSCHRKIVTFFGTSFHKVVLKMQKNVTQKITNRKLNDDLLLGGGFFWLQI